MKVSIIIGTYNGEKTIRNAIESIVIQSFCDYEIIICDDCSTDNTWTVLEELKHQYDKYIVLLKNKENLTLAGSLNHCLEVAQGEYIARIDQDDVMLQNRLKIQTEYLDKNADIAVIGTCLMVNNGDRIFYRSINETPNLELLLKGGYAFFHPTIMMRKNVMIEMNGYRNIPECNRCEDLDLWYRLFMKGYKGHNFKEPYVKYGEYEEDFNKRTKKTAKTVFNLRKSYREKCKKPFYYDFLYMKSLIFAYLPNHLRFVIKRKF